MRDPETMRRVARAARELREKDRAAAAIEAGLQPCRVVSGARRGDRPGDHRNPERPRAPREHGLAAIATQNVRGKAYVGIARDDDARTQLDDGLARVAQNGVLGDLDPRGEKGRAVSWIDVDEDSRAGVVRDRVVRDVRVEHRLASVGRTNVNSAPGAVADGVAVDVQVDGAEDDDPVSLRTADGAVRDRDPSGRAARAADRD